ncbi:MAG TPA: hypothetical protein VGQ83_14715 [Polyangia bacterium]|jgi:hypothetical protein
MTTQRKKRGPTAPAAKARGRSSTARQTRRAGTRRAAAGRGHEGGAYSCDLGTPSRVLPSGARLVAEARGDRLELSYVDPAAAAPGPAAGERAAEMTARLERVGAIWLATEEVLGEERRAAAITQESGLPAGDEALLRAGGFEPARVAPGAPDPVARAAAEFAKLIVESYTVDEAAARLGVNDSRVRQRLTGAPRTLFGFKVGGSWRVPRLQFDGRKLLAGVAEVVAGLPPDLDPVSAQRWLTSPNADLVIDGDRPVSPLDWLRTGRPAARAAALAAEL